MPVPRSGTSVFSFGAGVEKIRRCDVELLRRMVLWEVSTGLSMWPPAMGVARCEAASVGGGPK